MARSCTRADLAGGYLRHLLSEETQVRTYAELGGQSADRRAWLDAGANEQAGLLRRDPPDNRGRLGTAAFRGISEVPGRGLRCAP